VGIEIGNVGDIVALRFEPKRSGKFPEEEFAGTLRERGIEDLAVFSVRTVETDEDVTAPIPFAFAVIVEGELRRPAIVSAPGGVTALEGEISGAIVADDEDDVGLKLLSVGGEFAEVDAAGPIARDLEFDAGFPGAIAEAFVGDGRIGLSDAADFTEGMHFAGAFAAVVTHAEEVESEIRAGIGADVKGDGLAGADAGVGAVSFDPWAAILGGRIDLSFGEEPFVGAGAGVLAGDEIARLVCGLGWGKIGAAGECGGGSSPGEGLEGPAAVYSVGWSGRFHRRYEVRVWWEELEALSPEEGRWQFRENVDKGNLRKLASQARHEFVSPKMTFASRIVMPELVELRGFFDQTRWNDGYCVPVSKIDQMLTGLVV
jgi:hypothetical protein